MSENIVLDDGERQPCEVWTRVMGYHRPVTSFNKGKQGEYADRVCFEVDERKAACDRAVGSQSLA